MATKNNNSIVLDYLLWVWTFGGEVIDADGKVQVASPEATAALEFMVELMQERLAAPEIDRPDASRLFAQGASAFYFDAPVARTFARQFSGQGEAYDVNVLPIKTPVLAEGADPAAIQWGHVMAMFDVGDTSKDGAGGQVDDVSALRRRAGRLRRRSERAAGDHLGPGQRADHR